MNCGGVLAAFLGKPKQGGVERLLMSGDDFALAAGRDRLYVHRSRRQTARRQDVQLAWADVIRIGGLAADRHGNAVELHREIGAVEVFVGPGPRGCREVLAEDGDPRLRCDRFAEVGAVDDGCDHRRPSLSLIRVVRKYLRQALGDFRVRV